LRGEGQALFSRHTGLNSDSAGVDKEGEMSTPRDNSPAAPGPQPGRGTAPTGGVSHKDPQARLAHELANLLDGSLRNVGLVMSSLRDTSTHGAAPGDASNPNHPQPPRASAGDVKPFVDDDLLRRLESANQAMQHMATLLHRWMSRTGSRSHVHHDPRMLGEIVDSAIRLLTPIAAARRITLRTNLNPDAAALPAGPLYAVIANAVRNSIEAIMLRSDASAPGEVVVDAVLAGGDVVLSVVDNGPGVSAELFDPDGRLLHGVTTKQGGHGIGLSVAREVIEDLGGAVELTNIQPRGAKFTARYPAASVMEHA